MKESGHAGRYFIKKIRNHQHISNVFFFQFVKVNSNRSGIILTAVLLFFGALIALMAATGGYVYYKKRREPHSGIWNVSSRNPEYIDTVGFP